jgi:5-(carboxyamino)imidazole ribonucleotide synthase
MIIGIIGGGQLARMLAQEGQTLGARFSFLVEPQEDWSPVKGLGEVVVKDPAWDTATLYQKLGRPQVITTEREAVDTDLLQALADFCRVAPDHKAVSIMKNRSNEKQFIESLNIPTARFAIATNRQQVIEGAAKVGLPLIIKSSENGYDGKNQWRIKTQEELNHYVENYSDLEVILEQWINFETEVSMVATRSLSGEIAYYALTENVHSNGILLTSVAPAVKWREKFETTAQHYMKTIMEALNYVGTMAMECFIAGDDLLINELAPRVHNSGHWTLTGTQCSQFKNHLLAILGVSLGETEIIAPTAMLNLLGKEVQEETLPTGVASLNWYNKKVKPGRKVGHINIMDQDPGQVMAVLEQLKTSIYGDR